MYYYSNTEFKGNNIIDDMRGNTYWVIEFEALLIDYALLEDRLRAMLYHMGFLTDRFALKIWKKKSADLREIVAAYKESHETN